MARNAQSVNHFKDLAVLGDAGANALAFGFVLGHLADVLALVADGLGDLGVADLAVQPCESEDLAEIVIGDRGPDVGALQHVRRQCCGRRSNFGHLTSPND
ncbi:hypothetical protein [Streptomyces niveus]|uniref:hypothetical protein n=1 Tax=Streptomyces niveus TaxID=193462 RepID=UPI0035D62807